MSPFLFLILVIFLFPLSLSPDQCGKRFISFIFLKDYLALFLMKSLLLLKFRKFLASTSSNFSLPQVSLLLSIPSCVFFISDIFFILEVNIWIFFSSVSFLYLLVFSVWEFLVPCYSFCHLYNCWIYFYELLSLILGHIFLLLWLPRHFSLWILHYWVLGFCIPSNILELCSHLQVSNLDTEPLKVWFKFC